MDAYQKLLARALPGYTSDDTNDPVDAAAAPDHPSEAEPALSGQQQHHDNVTASPSGPVCNPQLEERISNAIKAARRSFKSQQKQRAAKDLEFIRADLNSACAAAEELMNSWPSLKIPDSSSEDLNDWPTPAPEHKPNPPGVVHPAPSARVFRGPRNDITKINSRSVEAPVWVLPTHSRVPPYKSWAGLRRNEISIETGQKMFYMDADGETIPLSDDEGFFTTEQHDARILEGLQREETNAILLDVLNKVQYQDQENEGKEEGANEIDDGDVLETLAWQMGISLDAMENRFTELKGQQNVSDAQQQKPVVNTWEEKSDFDILDKDFHAVFCRLCRKYGCRVHSGDHPRPVYGPMSVAEEKEREKHARRRLNGRWRSNKDDFEDMVIAEREPCGSQCYRLFLSAQELEAEAREAAAAAAVEVEEGDDDDDEEEEEEEEEIQKQVQEQEEGGEPLNEGNAVVDTDFVELVEDAEEVINLVTTSEEEVAVPMENAKEIEEEEETEKEAGAAAAVEYGEVTSPVKKNLVENNSGLPEEPLPRLPALHAVLSNAGGDSWSGAGRGNPAAEALNTNLKVAQMAFEIDSKAQRAARAAAAQSAPLSASRSRRASPINSQNNSGGRIGGGGDGAVADDVDVPATAPLEIVPTISNTDVNNNTHANAPTGTAPPTTSIENQQQQPAEQQQQQLNMNESPWEQWEENALQKGFEIWGKQPCKLAALLGTRTCFQVRSHLLTLVTDPLSKDLFLTKSADRVQNYGYNRSVTDTTFNEGMPYRRKRKGGKNAQPSVVYQRFKRSTEEAWPQYHPCGCQGPCKDSCPCRGDVNFCEKYCGCDPEWCGNRFQGCQCKCGTQSGKRCSTKQCPCLAAGRECDPDLCRLCMPTLLNANEPGYQCNNFRLRLRQKRRVLMGLSDVIGWGAFLAGPAAKKDDFIGEYCGELIDQKEADRRGKVYDRDDNSYLFNLNEQWVIDARQKGNKLRFANHSTTANCRAEILVVDGDHRVAVTANKDLMPGEELFYDYRYDRCGAAPDWAQGRGGRGASASGGSGRGRGRGRGR